MLPEDLKRILSNVEGEIPQIYFSTYDPLSGTFMGGPWVETLIFDEGQRTLVVLVKSVNKSQFFLQVLRETLRFLFDFLPPRRPVKPERGFP